MLARIPGGRLFPSSHLIRVIHQLDEDSLAHDKISELVKFLLRAGVLPAEGGWLDKEERIELVEYASFLGITPQVMCNKGLYNGNTQTSNIQFLKGQSAETNFLRKALIDGIIRLHNLYLIKRFYLILTLAAVTTSTSQ